jgi:hypothetical protein
MTRPVVVQCDGPGCDEEIRRGPFGGVPDPDWDDGWISLHIRGMTSRYNDPDFCSLGCLIEWAEREKARET